MKKSGSILSAMALIAGVVAVADARGPKLSVDVEAFCGYPAAYPTGDYDEYGNPVLIEVDGNVAILLTDESTGPAPGQVVGSLDVTCFASVKNGRGRPKDERFDGSEWGELHPDFGVQAFMCDLNQLPEGAIEWKAMVKASGGDLTRDRIDFCEEVPVY
jgi:hypothetical protein